MQGAKGQVLEDQIINQALKYLDQFDQSNGVSFHLVKALIKIDG